MIVLRSQQYLIARKVLQSTDLIITAPARFATELQLHSLAPITTPN